SVSITPRSGGKPALWAGFTGVSFGPVDPNVYRFTPPAGSRVIRPGPDAAGALIAPLGVDTIGAGQGLGPPRTFGSGWSTVLAIPLPPATLARPARGPTLASLFPLSAPLFSGRLVQVPGRTWLVIGMVPQRTLESVAAELS